MRGSICLIKISKERIVPAICLNDKYEEKLLFAQIRSAREEEIPNKKKGKKDIPLKGRQEQNRKSQNQGLAKTWYIGQPEGVKSKSVVMVTKQYQISGSAVVKVISKAEEGAVDSCLKLLKNIKRKNDLHEEMKLLKRKLILAQINNEPYSNYEARIDQILEELGYSTPKKKNNKAYRNFREVPSKGYIKVYYGGR